MSEPTVRFGLVGAGGIAQAYAQAFEECPCGRIVAVADVRPEAARALAERLGCPGFASHEELAESTDLDAVIVCTPPASHPEVCLSFLRRGKHVLCEKPLSISSAAARAQRVPSSPLPKRVTCRTTSWLDNTHVAGAPTADSD